MKGVQSMEVKNMQSAPNENRREESFAVKTKTIRQKEFIPAKPVEIYDALLNEEKHSAFTGARATCERHVGGRFTAWDGYISGKNIKLENGRRIVQEWMTTEWPKGHSPSILEVTLKPKGEGTEIHLVQTNVPAKQAANYKQGWIEHYWTPLKKYFGRR
jgi:activator of HSP90 ATPase